MNPTTSTDPVLSVEQARQYIEQLCARNAMQRRPHSYSKTLAQRYRSIAAALLLKHLAFCVRKARAGTDGCQRIIRSSAELSAHYPYLTDSTISATLGRIPGNVLRRERKKSRKTGALSTAYSFANLQVMTEADADLVYFDPTDAEKHGLHEAVLLHWLEFRISKKMETNLSYRHHPVSATELAPKLGISRASISRAIKALVDHGVLERNPRRNGKLAEYGISAPPSDLALPPPVLNPGNDALTSR